MVGIDAVLLFIFVLKFIPLFYARASVYLFTLNEHFLVFSFIPLVLLAAYLTVSFMRQWKHVTFAKTLIIGFLGVFLIGSLLGLQVIARNLSYPYLYLHDGAVQTEDAIHALQKGNNPYGFNYSNGPFGAFPDAFSQATRENPAWKHYVYPPLQLVIGAPLDWLSRATVGFFDIRFLYLASFLLLIVSTIFLVKDSKKVPILLILLLFNPYFIQFFIAGFNDVFFLAWIALAAVLLQRKRMIAAAIVFGLAFASKQPALFIAPFFLTYVFVASDTKERVRKTITAALVSAAVSVLIVGPFFIWSPSRFIDDTLRYATGSAPQSYPISGFGASSLMLSAGWIRSMWSAYPFWAWQIAIGIPALVFLMRWQKRSNSIARMLAAYSAFTFVMLFFSRYFNDSHLAMISVVLILSFAASASNDVPYG
ncbi:MAG: glycosyltransferase 87 family protein [Candidatus Kerfeldbacteria bacterium]